MLDDCVLGFLGDIRGKSILDAGCGEGRFARMLADRDADVVAVDIVPEFIDLAKRVSQGTMSPELLRRWPWYESFDQKNTRPPSPEFALGDLTSLPRSYEQRFDIIVCYCVLNDIENLSKAVTSIARSLRGEGQCVVTIPNPYIVKPTKHICQKPNYRCTAFLESISASLTVLNYYRSLPETVNSFGENGLLLECIQEPLLPTKTAVVMNNEIRELVSIRHLPDPSVKPWFTVLKFRRCIFQ